MKSKTTLMLGLMILGCLGLAACDGGGAAPDGDAPKPAVMAETNDDAATSIPETDPETPEEAAPEVSPKVLNAVTNETGNDDPNTPPPPAPKPSHPKEEVQYEISGRAAEYAAPLAPPPLEMTPVPFANQEYAPPPPSPVLIAETRGEIAVPFNH